MKAILFDQGVREFGRVLGEDVNPRFVPVDVYGIYGDEQTVDALVAGETSHRHTSEEIIKIAQNVGDRAVSSSDSTVPIHLQERDGKDSPVPPWNLETLAS